MAAFLDSQGLLRRDWMVIAGGAVFLYQLDSHGRKLGPVPDRVPTDLDIIIDEAQGRNSASIIEQLFSVLRHTGASLRVEPLIHYGHLLTGPALSLATNCGLQVDITTELSQINSPIHPVRPRAKYKYPPGRAMLAQANTISHELIDGSVTVSHPGFIAFYKWLLARNDDVKQDTKDLKRLQGMGLLTAHPANNLRGVLATMCQEDRQLIPIIEQAIARL
jgi:hypothetical protein